MVKIQACRSSGAKNLAKTNVYVGNQLCGQLPFRTTGGYWYIVKCHKPLVGKKVRLVTNKRIDISGIYVYKTAFGHSNMVPLNSSSARNKIFKVRKNPARYGVSNSRTCTFTKPGKDTFWEVGFKGKHPVNLIYFQTCRSNYKNISNAYVYIDKQLCG